MATSCRQQTCRDPDFGTTFFSSAKATAWWDSRFQVDILCKTSPPCASPRNRRKSSKCFDSLRGKSEMIMTMAKFRSGDLQLGMVSVEFVLGTQNDRCLAWKGPLSNPPKKRTGFPNGSGYNIYKDIDISWISRLHLRAAFWAVAASLGLASSWSNGKCTFVPWRKMIVSMCCQ